MYADMPSDPHLEGQARVLASLPAFSCCMNIWISTDGVTSILEVLIPHTLH